MMSYEILQITPYVKTKLEHADYLRDGFNDFFNNLTTVDSPKFESKIACERNGVFEGIDNYSHIG